MTTAAPVPDPHLPPTDPVVVQLVAWCEGQIARYSRDLETSDLDLTHIAQTRGRLSILRRIVGFTEPPRDAMVDGKPVRGG